MRLTVFFLSALIAAVSLGARAQEIDCENAMTQQDMNFCARRDAKEADAKMDAAWNEARAVAKEIDGRYSGDLTGAEKALLAAQGAWVAYRDNSCTLAGFAGRGGTMEPMLVSTCLADMTRARIRELRTFIEGRGEL